MKTKSKAIFIIFLIALLLGIITWILCGYFGLCTGFFFTSFAEIVAIFFDIVLGGALIVFITIHTEVKEDYRKRKEIIYESLDKLLLVFETSISLAIEKKNKNDIWKQLLIYKKHCAGIIKAILSFDANSDFDKTVTNLEKYVNDYFEYVSNNFTENSSFDEKHLSEEYEKRENVIFEIIKCKLSI